MVPIMVGHFDLLIAVCIGWQMRKYAVNGYNEVDDFVEEEPLFSEIGM